MKQKMASLPRAQSPTAERDSYIKQRVAALRRMIGKKFNTLHNNQDLWLGKTTGKPISNKALNKNCSEARRIYAKLASQWRMANGGNYRLK